MEGCQQKHLAANPSHVFIVIERPLPLVPMKQHLEP